MFFVALPSQPVSVEQIAATTSQRIGVEALSKPAEVPSSRKSHQAQNRLLVALTASSPRLKSEMDQLVEECQNNSEQWPALHWAIAKLHRPDVAIHLLQLYPEQIHALTPKSRDFVTLWRFRGWAGDEEEEVGFTTDGASALWLAVQEGSSSVVRALIENGADLNFMRKFRVVDNVQQHWLELPPGEWGATALSEAIQLQKKDIVQLLLEAGASTDCIYYDANYTRIPAAGWKRHTSSWGIAPCLIRVGAEKDLWRIWLTTQTHQPISTIAEEDIDFVQRRFQESHFPIQFACSKGDLETAQKLIDLGVNPHTGPGICETLRQRGWTFESVEFLLRNNIESSKFLLICVQDQLSQFLSRALDFGVKCEEAFRVAIERNESYFITLFLAAHHPVSPSIIYQAIRSNNMPLLEKLTPLINKEELQSHFDRADSPAVDLLSDRPEALDVLLNRGFLFDKESLFRHACRKGSILTVKLLVKKYGFPYDMQKELITIAAREQRDELLDYLWDMRADK